MEQCRLQVPSSSCLETWVFFKKNLKQKNSLAPQIILLNHSFCSRSSPRQSCCLLFSYHLIRLMWSSGQEQRGTFALLILLSQKQDPSRNESYNLIKMCKCVVVFGGGWINSFAWSISLLYFPWMWTIFLFFFLFDMPCRHVAYLLWVCIFFFLTCLLSMWHTFSGYASFISFCITHILYGHLREKESWYVMEFHYVGGWKCLLSVSGCLRDLDHESMTSL